MKVQSHTSRSRRQVDLPCVYSVILFLDRLIITSYSSLRYLCLQVIYF